MEAQPLQSVSPADSGKGGGPKKSWDKAWTMMVEGSPSIKLGLGIGVGSRGPSPVNIKHVKSTFTHAQLQELQLQSLIFKYIVAGLPVPLHLVLPIWKSVASSFGSANGGIYKQYPSFIGFSPQGFDYRNMMDPEPGRCRRTDGKKWRCSKDVVPDQKYCERHMHRGRQRSRKPVEASKIPSPSSTMTAFKSNNNSENSNTTLSISVPGSLQLKVSFPNNNTTTTSSNNESNNIVNGTIATTTAAATTTTTATTTDDNNNYIDEKDGGIDHVNDKNNIHRSSNNGNNNNVGSNVSPGFGFSPKSVLQGGTTILGCSSSCFDYRYGTELEPARCRRTDGKKWRCRRDVIPDQKYCGRHMHRGAKKHVVASKPVTVAAATISTPNKAGGCVNLKTNLSISISASPQLMTSDENSTSSSSSETTVTNSDVSHRSALSP